MAHAATQDWRDSRRRVETLIGALEADSDREEAAAARELVGLILDLHGDGLAAMMAVIGTASERDALFAQLVEDEHARGLLLLHGLHPDSVETRVRQAVDRLRAPLGVDGIRVEVQSVIGGEARVRITCRDDATGGPRRWLLPVEIEQAIVAAAPEIERVKYEGLDAARQPLAAGVAS